jgi:glycosyltransferase involved in cell wall biosynthesis
MKNLNKKQVSIILPVYNEEMAVKGVIGDLKNLDLDCEIIVVNDASTDKSKNILENIDGIKLINHPYNKGYGAALKTGIKNAKYENLLFFDADGQHPTEKIVELLKYIDDFDMVSGARTEGKYKGPFIRLLGKKLLHIIANYLAGVKIPDLNCGFRIVKKQEMLKFLHIMPNGFSLSTTTTLAFIKEGLNVKFVPIQVKKRAGKSTVKPKDALRMLLLILRIILLFSPLKIFLPISFIFFIGGFSSAVYDIFFRPFNITDVTILLLFSSILIFFFGLMADQLAAIRREIK